MLSPSVPIAILASAPWKTPAPVNAHQIAKRLARRGYRVLFVESTGLRTPSLRSGHDRSRVLERLRGALRGPVAVSEGLHVVAPLTLPAGWSGVLRAASDAWVAATVRRALERLEMAAPLAWCFLPTGLATARAIGARRIVYHCVDRYAANPGVDADQVEAAERAMLGAADHVLASSPALAEHLGRVRSDVVCVPNVADVALFSTAVEGSLHEPAPLAGIPRPRLVYTGNLAAYRVDLELLERLADARPRQHLVLVGAAGLGEPGGPPAALSRLVARPNVHAFGPVAQAELPAWLAFADVALIPFLDNDHTRGSLPLKLWEYAAAGLPVVASDLPQFRALAEDGTLRVAQGSEGFASAVEAALAEPASARGRRLERARAHDWEARIDELLEVVAGGAEALG